MGGPACRSGGRRRRCTRCALHPTLHRPPMSAARVTVASVVVARLVLAGAIGAVLLVAGCHRGTDADPAKAAAAAAPPPVAVHTVRVQPRSVPIRFEVVGQVEGSKEVEVRARVAGTLQKQDYQRRRPRARRAGPVRDRSRVVRDRGGERARAACAEPGEARAGAPRRGSSQAAWSPIALSARRNTTTPRGAADGRGGRPAVAWPPCAKRSSISPTPRSTHPSAASRAARSTRSARSSRPTRTAACSPRSTRCTPVWVRFSLAPTDLAKIPGGRITRCDARRRDARAARRLGVSAEGPAQLRRHRDRPDARDAAAARRVRQPARAIAARPVRARAHHGGRA